MIGTLKKRGYQCSQDFFVSRIGGESVVLGFTEGANLEGFVGTTKESTIHLEFYEVEVVCAVCGGTVGYIQGVKCVGN